MNKQAHPTSTVHQAAVSTLGLVFAAGLVAYPNASSKANLAVPAQLEGEWRYGRISSVQYYNPSTGQPAQPNGSSDQFKLATNGNYERQRLLQINTYGCASNLFIWEKGQAKVEGQRLTFQPAQSLSKGQICNSGRTYEKRNAAQPETYGWLLETNESGQKVLVLETTDGKGRTHYGRPL